MYHNYKLISVVSITQLMYSHLGHENIITNISFRTFLEYIFKNIVTLIHLISINCLCESKHCKLKLFCIEQKSTKKTKWILLDINYIYTPL